MRTKQQARLIWDVGNPEFVSTTAVSHRNTTGSRSNCGVDWEALRVFLSEVTFGMIEHNLDQHSGLLSTLRVRQ